jgi:polysaccharide export outer membrane protein
MFRPQVFSFVVLMLALCTSLSLFAQVPPPLPDIDPTKIDNPAEKINPVNSETIESAKETTEEENRVKNELEEKENARKKEEEDRDILALKRQSELPEAKIWGQQFFRNQSISLFTRSRDIKAIDSYELGIGDAIEVTVWGAVDFSKSVQINAEGFIDLSIPDLLVPRLYVKGMKFADVRKAIYERLSQHMNMRGSLYDIQLNYSRSITVNITGEVFNPGSYTIPAINTAFNALVASGGPSQIGSVRKINVVSSDRPTRVLDVYEFATNPNVADEFFLRNNDYIFVPLADRVVEIKGSVKRPYYYELIEGENLKTALQFAGGLEADAYLRNIQIKRYINDEERIIDINLGDLLQSKEDFNLMNGDIVNIATISEAYSNYITIDGAVKLPGEYELEQGTKIKDVLIKSGIMLSAVMQRIYIQRIRPDFSIDYISVNVDSIMLDENSQANIPLRALDKIEVKFKSNFVDQYDVQLYGAVRSPGAYIYSDSLTLNDLIYLANGIQNEAANSIIEVSRLIPQTDGTTTTSIQQFQIKENLEIEGAEGFRLEPYDQIFVRLAKGFELPRNVRIQGEIFYPGEYTLLRKGERISDLIQRAGGISSIAFLEGAKLQRPGRGFVVINLKEVLEDTASRFNYRLEAGDVLTIPRTQDLIAVAGRINHPEVKDQSEIDEIELKLRLRKAETDIEREEILAEEQISRKKNPTKINVPFHKGKRAKYYIREYAGGVDWQNGGRKRLVYVRYADGSYKKTRNYLLFKVYPKVEKGAMVYVDTKSKKDKENKYKAPRQRIDWNNVIRDGFALATSSLTLYLAIRALTQ